MNFVVDLITQDSNEGEFLICENLCWIFQFYWWLMSLNLSPICVGVNWH